MYDEQLAKQYTRHYGLDTYGMLFVEAGSVYLVRIICDSPFRAMQLNRRIKLLLSYIAIEFFS